MKRGFTLIELLIVISVIAVIAGIAIKSMRHRSGPAAVVRWKVLLEGGIVIDATDVTLDDSRVHVFKPDGTDLWVYGTFRVIRVKP